MERCDKIMDKPVTSEYIMQAMVAFTFCLALIGLANYYCRTCAVFPSVERLTIALDENDTISADMITSARMLGTLIGRLFSTFLSYCVTIIYLKLTRILYTSLLHLIQVVALECP